MEEEVEKLVANRNSLDADVKRLSDEKITLALENRFLREACEYTISAAESATND